MEDDQNKPAEKERNIITPKYFVPEILAISLLVGILGGVFRSCYLS